MKTPCAHCHGSGKVSARRTWVKIPAGIGDDQSIALRGQGDAGANGGHRRRDRDCDRAARPMFERDGYDVWVTEPITLQPGRAGADIVVPTVDGKLDYTVPGDPRAEPPSGCGARASSTWGAAAAATSM